MTPYNFIEGISRLFKQRKRKTLYLGALLAIIFLFAQVFASQYLTIVPAYGGSFTEGLVGYHRFVNPVLALSQTDKDLSNLLFSGMFRHSQEGKIVKDLAQSYEVNASSTQYTILLRNDVYFHDGSPITSEDIAYTYDLIRDPIIKSPLYPRLQGVNWEIIDERTITFNLTQSDPSFLETLTVGILSHKQWEDVSFEEFPFSPKNISPVGSGPYAIESVNRNKEQRITSFVLTAHTNYPHTPYISEIEVIFYPDQDSAVQAFEVGLIDNLANISPRELLELDHALEQKTIQSYPLNRNFALFFNQENSSVLEDTIVRASIRDAIDKQAIIEEVLLSRADVSDGPLPSSHPYYIEAPQEDTASTLDAHLQELGWSKDENGIYSTASSSLGFTIHVPDVTELKEVANKVARDIENIGIATEVIPVDQNKIINDVIRPRNYELLIFGQLVDDPRSLYSFWHSSATTDPGINIAGIENKTIDAIVERLVSGDQDEDKRVTDYHNLQKTIREEVAAVFLYNPHFIYAMDTSIQNSNITTLRFAWDRFNGIRDWYIATESLLPWFVK